MTSSDDPTRRCLVLIGPMGAGKTSVGRRVAKTLGASFTDTDSLIVREHGPIADIFRDRGESHFRELEHRAVESALTSGGVVALGGGAVLDARTRELLASHDVVYLSVSPEGVAVRIRGNERPLLAGEDPLVRWERIFNERRALYEQVADMTFDTSSAPFARIVAEIADWAQTAGSEHE